MSDYIDSDDRDHATSEERNEGTFHRPESVSEAWAINKRNMRAQKVREWTFEGHAAALVARWEQGTITADEVVREIRTTLREEAEIHAATT